jgi:hypothetical protein
MAYGFRHVYYGRITLLAGAWNAHLCSTSHEDRGMLVASVMKEFNKQDPLNLPNAPPNFRRRTSQRTTSRCELNSQKAFIALSTPVRCHP